MSGCSVDMRGRGAGISRNTRGRRRNGMHDHVGKMVAYMNANIMPVKFYVGVDRATHT